MVVILVTGGLGFMGSNFIRFLLKLNEPYKIINVDKISYAGNLNNLKDIEFSYSDKYTFYRVDICDFKSIENIVKEEEVNYIINFAAESHVDRSIDNPNTCIETNIIGTKTLLNTARNSQVEKFVQISTDEVYGSLTLNEDPFTEISSLSPSNPYSASKAAADLLINAYYKTYNIPINIVRCSNNYGPYQFPEKLIPLIINNALNDKELPIYGKGINVRDWIYVEDNSKAIYTVLKKGKNGETYNIAGKSEISNIDLVKKLLKMLNKPESLIKFVKDRPGHDLRYTMNITKIANELGWKPEIQLEDGLKKTIQWYLDNKDWLNKVISKEYLTFYEKWYSNRL